MVMKINEGADRCGGSAEDMELSLHRRSMLPTHLTHDVGILFASVVCWLFLGSASGVLFKWFVTKDMGVVFLPDDKFPSALTVLVSLAYLVGRMPWDYLGGALLGRYLRGLNAWSVFMVLAACISVAHLLAFSLVAVDNEWHMKSVGVAGAGALASFQFLGIVGMIALGVFFGSRKKEQTRQD